MFFFSFSYRENEKSKYLENINELIKSPYLTLEVDHKDIKSFDPNLANHLILNPYTVDLI